MEAEYLKLSELQEKLSIEKGTVYRLIKKGLPVVHMPSGSRRYRWRDVDDWLRSFTRTAEDETQKIVEEMLS